MLRGALASTWAPLRAVSTAARTSALRPISFEAESVERALLWGRCCGGAIVFVLGPITTPTAPALLFQLLGLFFFGYALVTLRMTRRARSVEDRVRAQWTAHALDTVAFVAALALSATDPQWIAVNAAPLYILVSVARLGVPGGIVAALAVSAAHVVLVAVRSLALGIPADAPQALVSIAVYGLAALIAGALDIEARALRSKRDLQVAVHEPLLRAHDDLGQGVLISEAGRPVYVSDGLSRMTGLTREEILAMPSVFELIPPEDREMFISMTRALPPEGGNIAKRLRTRSGENIEVDVALRRYTHEGRSRSVAIIRDVTVRKQAMEDLARMQRLDSLGALAAGIAHDFNNLLAVIVNNAYVALEAGGGRREMEQIKSVAEQGIRRTREMLAFTRGADEAPPAPVDLRSEIGRVEPLLRRFAGPAVALTVSIDPAVAGAVLAPGRLERILLDLVANARDAMVEGGRIAIRADLVALGAQEVASLGPGRFVRITVSDTGSGMSPDVASRAFEPFFTTKSRDRGTGLGLATVYASVRAAGGHVALASAPGRGTTVALHLVAADPSDGAGL